MAKGTVFSLENLKLLDFGKIGLAFQAEVERVVKDCLDRPNDDHARVVELKFLFAPTVDPSQGLVDCESVKVQAEIRSKVPQRRTKIYEMLPRADGKLSFNPDLPLEPDEDTIFNDQERKEDDE